MKISIETTSVDGVLEIESSEWGGKILKMPRKTFIEWRNKGKLPKTAAVYALYADHFDKSKFGKELYIGHTASIEKRVLDHLTEKDFWSVLLVFVSEKDWMNIAYTQNIEYQFIKMAKNANRYDVKNGNDSSPTHLGEEDKKRLDNFLEGIPFVVEMAGIDIFTFNLDGLYVKNTRSESSSIRVVDLEHKNVEILAGSTISCLDLHDVPITDDVIIEKSQFRGGLCKFEKDTLIKINDDFTPKLFGNTLSGWKSQCGIGLSKALR
jgi:hypothetical protein